MSAHQPIEPRREALEMWVIYDHPLDNPEQFVARKLLIGDGIVTFTAETMSEDDIDTLRKYFEIAGLARLPRQPMDDPVIVESWL